MTTNTNDTNRYGKTLFNLMIRVANGELTMQPRALNDGSAGLVISGADGEWQVGAGCVLMPDADEGLWGGCASGMVVNQHAGKLYDSAEEYEAAVAATQAAALVEEAI